MAADIFISFASKDLKVAMTLCKALETRGFSCWISARDIQAGENFQVAIVRALRHARIMLLVFTANSNNSEEMTKELALASQQKIIVIPLRVEDVTPNDAFAYEFATRQWIDAFADWETSLDQLSRRVAFALTADSDRASPPVVAVEPEPVEVIEAPKAAVPEPPAAVEPEPTPEKVRAPSRTREPTRESTAAVEPAAAEPEAAEPRKRGVLVPLAIAAGVAVAVAVAATTLFRAGSGDAPALASNPPPRLAPAVVVQPLPPPTEATVAPPEEEAPRLVKSADRRKSSKNEPAAHVEDIPF